MPEPNVHIAGGISLAYIGGKILGLDLDYLIVGAVGALFAYSRMEPNPINNVRVRIQDKLFIVWGATFNIAAVSFFSASATTIGVYIYPSFKPVAIAIAGLIGFFGTAIVKTVTSFITHVWKALINRIGGIDDHLSDK